MDRAARGQLNERGMVRGKDELASLGMSYNILIDSLGSFFEGLHKRLSQLEDGGKDLSVHMEETAAAVSQIQAGISSSMGQFRHQEESIDSTVAILEQMTRSIETQDKGIIRQNESIQGSSSAVEQLIAQIRTLSSSTDEAELSMKVLHESSLTGQRNLQHVAELVTTISEKSQELEEANTIISGIASRTNLLAMNAAIQAAHAGTAGRGFAVVADEIRKLAEQAAGQSKQVKDSISEINSFIREVVEESRVSGQSYEDILQNIDRVGLLTSEIRSSMEEQSSGGSLVLKSLKEMRDFADAVQEGSGEMNRGNKVILSEVSSLRDVNRMLNQAMKEIALGIDEINSSVLTVSELAVENQNSIEGVREDASRYTL
jgi:methyl-accepting chemotaxis protein